MIRQWMEKYEFVKLQKWLEESKEQLEDLFEEGEVPVAGWLQLADILTKGKEAKNVDAEIDENERESQQVAKQIRMLEEKQVKLADRKQQLLKIRDEIDVLQTESQSIAMLAEKEEAALAKLAKKMENPYFMQELDSGDFSTLFSTLHMDSLFSLFKKHDTDNNLEVTATAAVGDLQKNLKMHFSEAVELLWKLKLLKKGEKGVAGHLAKCGICSTSKPGVLLQEYGIEEECRKEIEEKIKDWKGYYFAAANAVCAATKLDLAPALRPKFTSCWLRIQKAHKWNE